MPWMTGHSQTAQSGTSLGAAMPRSIVSRVCHRMRRKPGGSSHWSPVLGHLMPILLLSDRNTAETTAAAVGGGRRSRPLRKNSIQDSSTLGNKTGQRKPCSRRPRNSVKRACKLTARGSISKAMKGLVGGAATGAAERWKHWSTSRYSPELWPRYTSLERGASSSDSSGLLGAEADANQPAAL